MRTKQAMGLLFCVVLGGCGSSPVAVADLAAQRAEQAAITAEWLEYVVRDPALTAEQKQSRQDTARAQELRISAAEKAAGVVR